MILPDRRLGGKTERTARSMTDIQLLGLLGLPQPNFACLRGKNVLLQNDRDSRRILAVRLPCKRWTCPACRLVLCLDFGIRYARRLVCCDKPLWISQTGEWKKTRQWIRHQKAKWVRIQVAESSIVIGTVSFNGGVIAAPTEAVIELGHSLARVRKPPGFSGKFAPVSGCREWMSNPKTVSEYVAVDGTCDFEALVGVFRKYGVTWTEKIEFYQPVAYYCETPADWTEETRAAFRREAREAS